MISPTQELSLIDEVYRSLILRDEEGCLIQASAIVTHVLYYAAHGAGISAAKVSKPSEFPEAVVTAHKSLLSNSQADKKLQSKWAVKAVIPCIEESIYKHAAGLTPEVVSADPVIEAVEVNDERWRLRIADLIDSADSLDDLRGLVGEEKLVPTLA